MKYHIAGADATAGVERRLDVEAESEKDAVRIANERGIFPYKVSPVADSPLQIMEAPVSPRRKHTAAERKQNEQLVGAVRIHADAQHYGPWQ